MMWDDYSGSMHDGSFAGGWLFMVLVMVFLLALLAAVVFLLLRTPNRDGQGAQQRHEPSPSTAEQLLAERFARGELEEDEYRHRRDVLRL